MLPQSTPLFRRTLALSLCFLLVFLCVAPIKAALTFNVTDLGTIKPTDINNSGQVTGSLWTGSDNSFVIYSSDSGSTSNLSTLATASGITLSSINAINDSGAVVGSGAYTGTTTGPNAYLFSGGSFSILTSPTSLGTASDINNAGLISGNNYAGTGYSQAVLYSGSSHLITSYLGQYDWTDGATAINSLGQIAGTSEQFSPGGSPSTRRAYLYNGTSSTLLGTLGGTYSDALGINDAGSVVGFSTKASGVEHGFLYIAGSMIDLGTLAGYSGSWANDINNSGLIVGTSDSSQFATTGKAFIFSMGKIIDLNAVTTNLATSNFASLNQAVAINDSGQIVGTGKLSDGTTHGYLLTPTNLTIPIPPVIPVPEPATYGAIGALTLLALVARRLRRNAVRTIA